MKRPVLHYHGGKFRLAPWIISNFPPHRFYVEPYGGAASVLMQKPRSFGEVYNDCWSVVVNIFRILRDPVQAAQLEQLLRLTPFSREEFDAPWPGSDESPLEVARRSILGSFAGFGSASINNSHSTGFRSHSNRSHTLPAHDWASYPDHIRLFTDRLRGVTIEHRPACDVIQQHDTADTLFYVDPPYVHTTRNLRRGNAHYAHEMTDAEHLHLAEVLHGVAGMVVLSGYRCELYERLFGAWERVERETFADGASPRVESLWLNPACSSRQRQANLFPTGDA